MCRRSPGYTTVVFGAEPYPEKIYDQALREHEELVGHIVRGEADAANRAAQAHFSLTLESMKVRLARLGGVG